LPCRPHWLFGHFAYPDLEPVAVKSKQAIELTQSGASQPGCESRLLCEASVQTALVKMITKYLLVWFLLAIVAIANGIVRQSTYGKSVSDLAAHQISTITAILASGAVVWFVNRFWPIEAASQARAIGFSWLVLTIVFEFGFGHYVAGHSWNTLLADYNLLKGRVWPLFLVWVTVMPFVIYKVAAKAA